MGNETTGVVIGDDETAVEAVVDLIAAKRDVDVLELSPLHDFIETSALNKLVEDDKTPFELEFQVEEMKIQVFGGKLVRATEKPKPQPA